MTNRIFNFSPGPAVLPETVLEQVRENLFSFGDSGLGVMELSHRGPHFTGIIEEAEEKARNLLGISEDFAVAFMTGGATLQFSAVPMNLGRSGQTNHYILTGAWSKKALKEAEKFGPVHVSATSEGNGFRNLPTEFDIQGQAAYAHFTSNNTIFGTQFLKEPETSQASLVCDASSDLMCRPLDLKKYGLIYAGAQKNLGIAGVTLVIIRKDLLDGIPEGLPAMLDYRTAVEKKSLFNTPPTFPIYVFREMMSWLEENGGLAAAEERNRKKAALLYEILDANDFFRPYAERESRSLMNVTFRLAKEDLEAKFIEEAAGQGLSGLKGHRSVGGLRASIYNAFPLAGVEALCSFMQDFAARNG